MWDELWIELELTGDQIAAAVAKAHGLSPDQIQVVEGIAGKTTRSTEVTVHRTRGGGAFATRIQLSGVEPDDRRVFCARLASALGCKVLGDDGNINPLTFMLYEPGNATRIAVDRDKLEANEAVVIGPYDGREDEESHPTKPIRRYPEPSEHRSTRGGQVAHIVNDYMVEGLPRPPLVTWTPATTELYANLHRLLGTLAYRKATADELANVTAWTAKLTSTFPNQENAGWFVVEVIEAANVVLAAPWDPDLPAIEIKR